VTVDALLDGLLIPRPGGSPGLAQAAAFIAARLEGSGAEVVRQDFVATPHGLQLAWTAALLLMLAYLAALARGRARTAAALALAVPVLLMAEFELLWSPVSRLVTTPETNVIGTFRGAPGSPHLVLAAHYDTATHFGDHLVWGAWAAWLGPASALALFLTWVRQRRWLRPAAMTLLAAATVAPYAVMTWCHAVGPLVRHPSIGAVDNGGSVATLLRVAERVGDWPPTAPLTLSVVFFAAEEERALGSWHFARTLSHDVPTAVVNLESVGTRGSLGYVPEDGFGLRRFRSPAWLVALLDTTQRALDGNPLPAYPLPFGTLTDGRSLLAQGIPAVTLRGQSADPFPRGLHSRRDSRDRLVVSTLDAATDLLVALARRVTAEPALLRSAPRVRPAGVRRLTP
jgi:hypothetical protein